VGRPGRHLVNGTRLEVSLYGRCLGVLAWVRVSVVWFSLIRVGSCPIPASSS
jgi:hypothetical protein